jgi:hypothetical protein
VVGQGPVTSFEVMPNQVLWEGAARNRSVPTATLPAARSPRCRRAWRWTAPRASCRACCTTCRRCRRACTARPRNLRTVRPRRRARPAMGLSSGAADACSSLVHGRSGRRHRAQGALAQGCQRVRLVRLRAAPYRVCGRRPACLVRRGDDRRGRRGPHFSAQGGVAEGPGWVCLTHSCSPCKRRGARLPSGGTR